MDAATLLPLLMVPLFFGLVTYNNLEDHDIHMLLWCTLEMYVQ